MEDNRIIDLYWAREEQALTETERKYGGYCRTIARNILKIHEDAEECVSDTWLNAWNAMPPKRPSVLSAFLGKITRNLAFDRWKAAHAEKRGSGSLPLALDELDDAASEADKQAIEAETDQFTADDTALTEEEQQVKQDRMEAEKELADLAKEYNYPCLLYTSPSPRD